MLDLVGECDPQVEIAPPGINVVVVGLELDGDAGVGAAEGCEPRHQPHLGHGLDRDELENPWAGFVAVASDDLADLGEDAVDVAEAGLAAVVEGDAAARAVEQGTAEVAFEHADAVGDGGGGDLELLRGAHEALVASGGVKEAQALQRGQRRHGVTPNAAKT